MRRRRWLRGAWGSLALLSVLICLVSCGERERAAPRVEPPKLPMVVEAPDFEIRTEIVTTRDPATGARVVDGDLLVVVEDGISRASLERALGTLPFGARLSAAMPTLGIYRVTLEGDIHAARAAVEALSAVRSVSYDEVLEATRAFNDPALTGPEGWKAWGIRRIGAPEAWDATLGRGTVVVIDDGIQADHEDLAGRIADAWTWAAAQTPGASPRRGTSTAAQQVGTDLLQECSHGTHVAGTIAATAGNGKGTAGIAPGVRLVSLQVLVIRKVDGTWKKSGSVASIASALELALRLSPRPVAINMSLGASPPEEQEAALQDPDAQEETLRRLRTGYGAYLHALRAVAEAGIVVVKAAGNDSVPAGYSRHNDDWSTICVGAIDEDDARCSFSNYNVPASATTVDVCAPGRRIWSSAWRGAYEDLQGTSMAAPHVTGVVALMKAVNPDLGVREVRTILRETGTRLSTDQDVGPLVDAVAAVSRARVAQPGASAPPAPPRIDWDAFFTPRIHYGDRTRFVERSVTLRNRATQPVEFRIAFLRAFPKGAGLEWHWWPGAATPTGQHGVIVPAGATVLVRDDEGRIVGASRIVVEAVVPRSGGEEILSLGKQVLVRPNPRLGGAAAYEADEPETWTFAYDDPGRDRIRGLVRRALRRERAANGTPALPMSEAMWTGAQTLAHALAVLEDPTAIERAALNHLAGLDEGNQGLADAVSFWFAVPHAPATLAEDVARAAVQRMLSDRVARDLLLGSEARDGGIGAAAIPEGTLITVVVAQAR